MVWILWLVTTGMFSGYQKTEIGQFPTEQACTIERDRVQQTTQHALWICTQKGDNP